MLFKTKMIYDPTQTSRWAKQGNKMGLTIGFTHRTPKYWSCKGRDFDGGWLWLPADSLSVEAIDRRIDEGLRHAQCKWPYRHKSYKGYAYWTGPKRRYTFFYQGYTGIGPKHGLFSIRKHNTYTRWLDNGPQNSPRIPIDQDILDAVRDMHKREFAEIKAKVNARRKERGL